MFKFNFSQNDESEEKPKIIEEPSEAIKLKESKQIEISSNQYEEIAKTLPDRSFQMFSSNDLEIGYVNNVNINEMSHSDLISGVYEGGYKIWECTQDLADYFTGNASIDEFSGKTVCDLGCSAGIAGLMAFVNDAKAVHFQDYVSDQGEYYLAEVLPPIGGSWRKSAEVFCHFRQTSADFLLPPSNIPLNEEVVENFTIPNVVLYCEENYKAEHFSKSSFYSGDWDSFRELTCNEEKYDIILTSETIYNPNYYNKLLNFFKSRLKDDGSIYVAAKSHYFGVGGNILDFCNLIKADGTFKAETVWKSSEGLQREILLLKR